MKLEPESEKYRLEQAYAYVNLGVIALREARDPARAERYFAASQVAFRAIDNRRPNDPDIIYNIADGEAWLADVELERRNFVAAHMHRIEQKHLVDALLAMQPRNLLFRLANSSNQIGEAALASAQGFHKAALIKLHAAYAESIGLLATDPQNTSLATRKRAIELMQADSELELAASDPRALARAEGLIRDCESDWTLSADAELPVYCSILTSRAALLRNDAARARRIMSDARLDNWLRSSALSPSWQLDFRAECRKLGVDSLCR